MTNPCCKSCRFFEPSEHLPDQFGFCHRYAPREGELRDPYGRGWPRVEVADYCGDYDQKVEPTTLVKKWLDDPTQHGPIGERSPII